MLTKKRRGRTPGRPENKKTKEKGETKNACNRWRCNTHTHTLGNLINKKTQHKDMIYLCNFNVYKII